MRRNHSVAAAQHLGLIVVDPRYRDIREAYRDDITRTRHYNSPENGVFTTGKRAPQANDDETQRTAA